jgi:RNA polymerase sigma factor (TIGR02999 family)
VNEAYLRLARQRGFTGFNRDQFLALAATMMRRILVNHAEARHAAKRGGRGRRITLEPSHAIGAGPDVDVLSLNEALDRLAALDQDKARIVELRFFAGLTNDEIGTVLGRSRATIEREWSFSRAWLHRELEGEGRSWTPAATGSRSTSSSRTPSA